MRFVGATGLTGTGVTRWSPSPPARCDMPAPSQQIRDEVAALLQGQLTDTPEAADRLATAVLHYLRVARHFPSPADAAQWYDGDPVMARLSGAAADGGRLGGAALRSMCETELWPLMRAASKRLGEPRRFGPSRAAQSKASLRLADPDAAGRDGVLELFSETGTEGGIWMTQDPARPGYDGLETINRGDHVTVYDASGAVQWAGHWLPDAPARNWAPFPFNPIYGQQHLGGYWVHWLPAGIPDDMLIAWVFTRKDTRVRVVSASTRRA